MYILIILLASVCMAQSIIKIIDAPVLGSSRNYYTSTCVWGNYQPAHRA